MTSKISGFQALFRTSLAAQMAGRLRAEIAGMKPGDRLPSMREICRNYGVSINTVGSVVALLEQEGLVVRRAGSGVFVADRAARKRIGILSELHLFDPRIGPFWRSLAGKTKIALEAEGHISHLYVGNVEAGSGASDEPTCPRFWEDVAAGRLDAAVILDVPATPAWKERVRKMPIPAAGPWTPYAVEVDFLGIAQAAVARLAEQGCRRLGCMGWDNDADFVQAVQRHGLTTCKDWIRTNQNPDVRCEGWRDLRDIWSAKAGRPDGLVILDDMLFADAQLAMLEFGVRVPEEVRLAVVTSRGASPPLRLPLTAFEIDPAEVAAELVGLLGQRLAGESVAPVTRLVSFREVAVRPDEDRPVISDRLSVIGSGGAPAACSA